MSFSIITSLDSNIIVDRQQQSTLSKDVLLRKFVSGDTTYLFSEQANSSNGTKVSYVEDSGECTLLSENVHGEIPKTLTAVNSEQSNILANIYNVYIASYQTETLYRDAWSMALEIFVTYKSKRIVLSSTLLNMQQFKIARMDKFYANRYFSTICPIEVLDIRTMAVGNDAAKKFVAAVVDEEVSAFDANLLSNIQYRLCYVAKDQWQTSPENVLTFRLTEVHTMPEHPSTYSLQGDVNVACQTTSDGALSIGFDNTNPNLLQTLTQIATSTELLHIEHTINVTSYRENVNSDTFEHEGVKYSQLLKYDIKLSNPTEPQAEVLLRPVLHSDAVLAVVEVMTQISSSANSIALNKQSEFIFLGRDLERLKPVTYKFDVTESKVINKLTVTKNVVNVKSASDKVVAQEAQIVFAPVTAIHVANLNNIDDLVGSDFSQTQISLRSFPLTYAIRFVSETPFDLKTYSRIFAIYANSRIAPSKVEKDTLYFMLSWKDYEELSIEINGNIVAGLTCVRAV